MTTTFRTDTSTGIYNVLVAYAAANPSQLVRAYRAQPTGLVDLPCAWVASRDEGITHDSGTRTRKMSPTVIVARAASDNAEDALALDMIIDGLIEAFTLVPQFMPDTIWSEMTTTDIEVEIGDYKLPGVRLAWPNITIMEGRN